MVNLLDMMSEAIDLVMRERYPDGRVPSDVRVVAEGIKLDILLLGKMLPPAREPEGTPPDNVIRLDERGSGSKTSTSSP